ncbi:MAG: TolC family protein [Cytophagales bacterium]|nr:TolC family protein [Cytophagales bacterium]
MKRITIAVLFLFIGGQLRAQEALSLSDAVKIGLEKNYDIRISGQRRNISHVENSWGQAGLFPTFNFQANYSENWSGEELESRMERIDPGVRMNWTLFNGFSVRINKSRFEELESLSQGNVQLVVENTVKDIISVYYQALLEQEKSAVSERLAKLSGDRFRYTERQKELGTMVTYDLLQAKTAWLQDKSNYLRQQVDFKNALRKLNFLLGLSDDKSFVLTEPFEFQSPEYRLEALKDRLMNNNSSLKNQYINQKLKEYQIKLAKAAYMPQLQITGGASRVFTPNAVGRGDQPAQTKTLNADLGLKLSYSIFSGGNRRRAVQIAKINQEIGDIETDQLKHSLGNQLAQTFDNFTVQREVMELAEEQLKAAELNLKLSEQRYKSGSINSFNLRDVEIAFQNASNNKLNAIYRLITVHAELLRLTGGISEK